ncbi:hypothetical protein SteCoe_1708 [Stentor coeruleus]|uniref:Protein kinase domain-containing protein n=1 Tax=Stentor coeruleus TaxID=5963 RepID=A0A1R2D1C8_9CILI|nr:hypothetical protein SteCoe_1708 [Stentor coeruleus]
MELIDTVIEFLKEQHLDAIVKSIQYERKNPKKPSNQETWLNSAISEYCKQPLLAPEQKVMQNLLKKLAKKPLPKAPKITRVPRTLQKPKLPEQPPPAAPGPIPIKPVTSEVTQVEDDELFSASQIDPKQDFSSIIQPSNTSFGLIAMEDDIPDEYENDDDPGFNIVECKHEEINQVSKEIADKNGFPDRAMSKPRPPDSRLGFTRDESILEDKKNERLLPDTVKFPNANDDYYPVEFENVIYDCYNLKVLYDREKTGFEETKDFQIVINSIIAGRYQVIEYLGSAAFSKAIQCLDLITKEMVCLKIIENNKDYMDQSIDEIKILKYVNVNGNMDDKNIVKYIDCFYHKEHLIIVTELLRDNLYEFLKYNREHDDKLYFTIGRIQKIAYQVLKGLQHIHSLKLIHCDLKPENILMKSYSRCEVKIIDLGSACFIHDHLGSYVQSRSYRAPEVILGCQYDYRIDVWSLGCILFELFTGNVLFQNTCIQELLARVVSICGPLSEEIHRTGRHVSRFFTKEKLIYKEVEDDKALDNRHLSEEMIELIKLARKNKKKIQLLIPKRSSIKNRLHCNDMIFIDFLKCLLDPDKDRRLTVVEALRHPFITECKYQDGL